MVFDSSWSEQEVTSVKPMPGKFSLASFHLAQFGCKVEPGEIMEKYMSIAVKQNMNTSDMEVGASA